MHLGAYHIAQIDKWNDQVQQIFIPIARWLGATIWFWEGGAGKFGLDRLFIFNMNAAVKFIFRYTKARIFIFIRNKILK